jgi:hypothetical protein
METLLFIICLGSQFAAALLIKDVKAKMWLNIIAASASLILTFVSLPIWMIVTFLCAFTAYSNYNEMKSY